MAQLSDSDRSSILAEARTCIGTQFHFNHRERGNALDCVGVIRHVMGERGFYRPPDVTYTARSCWGNRIYLDARDGMNEIPLDEAGPGCVLLLWLVRSHFPQHLAFFTGNGLVHAHAGRRRVCEEPMNQYWASRVLGAFELRCSPEAEHRISEIPSPLSGRRLTAREGSRGVFENWGSGAPKTITLRGGLRS